VSRALTVALLLALAGALPAAATVEPFERPLPQQTEWWRQRERAAEAAGDDRAAAQALIHVCWEVAIATERPDPPECDEAVGRASRSGDRALLGFALALRGNERMWTGRYETAWADLDAALAVAPQASAGRASAFTSSAGARLEGGDFDGAFHDLEQALLAARGAGDREQEGWALIWLARVWAFLGAEGEAVEAADAGRALARERGDVLQESDAEWMLALAHLEVGDDEAALAPVQRSLELSRRAQSWLAVWLTEQTLTETLLGLGRYADAEPHLSFLEGTVAAGTAPPPFAAAVAELRGRSLLAAGRPAEAAAIFAGAAASAVVSPVGERARLGRARALLASGDRSAAIAAYRQAIGDIETTRRRTTVDQLRARFLTTRSDTYRELAQLLGEERSVEEALRTAEAGRARALADERAAVGIDAGAPRAGAEPFSARLPPGSALVEYVVTNGKTAAFVLGGASRGVDWVPLPGAGGASSLAERVDFFRRRALQAASADELVPAGRRLWSDLLGPVVARLPVSTRRLLVVPDGPLFRLPFAALATAARDAAPRFLVERYDLTLAPSAALALSGRRRAPDERPALVVSYAGAGGPSPPALTRSGTTLPNLRWAPAEVERVTAAVGRAVVLLDGPGATTAALRRLAPDHPILHFVAHGVVEDDVPSRSGLRLAPTAHDDGWLRAGDILRLHLAPGLVVLSSCRSGDGRLAGGEGPLSLAHAFLGAGASTVAATYWALDDRAAVGLVERFYARLASGAAADTALAAAERWAIARGEPPALWAAFALWGQPELRLPGRGEAPRVIAWAATAAAAIAALVLLVAVRRRRTALTRAAAPRSG